MAIIPGLPGRGQRVGVTAKAVVQDGGRPVRGCHRASLALGSGHGDGSLDQRGELGLVAAERSEEHGDVGRDAAPGRPGDRVDLRDQGGGRFEVTSPRVTVGERNQIDWQFFERSYGASELGLPRYDHACGIGVPQDDGGHPARPEPFFPGDVSGGKDGHSLPQRRRGRGRAVGDQPRQAVQDQVDRPRRMRGRGKGPGGAGDLEHVAGARLAPGQRCRPPGVQVGLTRQVYIQRLEPLSRLKQQRGCVTAHIRGESDVASHEVHPGALELVQGPGLRGREQVQGLAEHAGLQAGLRRS